MQPRCADAAIYISDLAVPPDAPAEVAEKLSQLKSDCGIAISLFGEFATDAMILANTPNPKPAKVTQYTELMDQVDIQMKKCLDARDAATERLVPPYT